MSKQNGDRNTLPSPRSPQRLDDKILAHARENAPDRTGSWRPAWTGGLATAAILVVAVYLTQLTNVDQPAPLPNSIPVTEEAAAPAAAAMKMQRAKPAQSADYAVERETAEAAGQARESSLASDAADTAYSARAPQPEAKPKKTVTQDLSAELTRLRELLASGELEQAQAEYEALRKSCPDCMLPLTLEQALDQGD